MKNILNSTSRWFARLTNVVIVFLAVALIASLLISIFFRYIVGQALSWPEEISLILFTWLVFLAGSLGVRENFHVRLSVITSRFPPMLQQILDRSTTAAIAIFGFILIYSGIDMVRRTAEHLTPTLRLSLDWLNYSAPVCGLLIVLHCLSHLIQPWKETSPRE